MPHGVRTQPRRGEIAPNVAAARLKRVTRDANRGLAPTSKRCRRYAAENRFAGQCQQYRKRPTTLASGARYLMLEARGPQPSPLPLWGSRLLRDWPADGRRIVLREGQAIVENQRVNRVAHGAGFPGAVAIGPHDVGQVVHGANRAE